MVLHHISYFARRSMRLCFAITCALSLFALTPLAPQIFHSAVPIAHADVYVPTQFIAKLYSEGLGRAPDQGGWSGDTNFFLNNGCNADTLSAQGQTLYTSSEFTNDYGDNAARVLALYRGALNRDPDQGGLDTYAGQLNGGTSWSDVVKGIFTSGEFHDLASSICNASAPNYHFGGQRPPTLPTGGGYTGDENGLQAALNSAGNSTVYLAQKAVINISTPLTIPQGVTLSTNGTPGPMQYALMGRLVRSASYQGPVVKITGGGALKNVWVDGQRNVLGYLKNAGGPGDNANIVSLGGSGTMVADTKLSDPQGGTDFYSSGSQDGTPCSNETITGNLVTAYSANHGYSDNSDGLTMHCENLDIENNNIVDVTDIGIVLFASDNVPEVATVQNNTIVSAGSSINGPIAIDPTTASSPGVTKDFSKTTFNTNTFWTGPNTSFDFGIVAGTREWFRDNANSTGGSFINNTTGSLSARVRAGIAVAGALNITITNDADHPLSFNLITLPAGQPAANCPGGNVIAERAAGNASGSFPAPDFDGNFDTCI